MKKGSDRVYQDIGKPVLDFLIAAMLLVLLAPVMGVVALIVRLRMGAPVLFRQERVGQNEQLFEVLKFRTMTNTLDSHGRLLPEADRMTPLGRFLRSLSLDELPQLWNVVKREMSLVGPRPLYPHFLPYYTDRERRRHEIRPGITGLAQVRGRARLPWDERLELDVEYVETLTFMLDWSILFQTIGQVLSRRDVVPVPAADRMKFVDLRRLDPRTGADDDTGGPI